MEFNDSFEDPDFDDTIVPNGVEKERFLTVCRESHRQFGKRGFDTDSILGYESLFSHDWKVYVSILVQMGYLDLNNDDENVYTELARCSRKYCISLQQGRIHRLNLPSSNGRELQCDLPPDICHLDALDTLWLGENVEFVPMRQLASLTNLTTFEHSRERAMRSDSFDGLDHSVNFIKLEHISVSVPTFLIIQDRCVNLEMIVLTFNSNKDFDDLVDMLCSPNIPSAETVKTVTIDFSGDDAERPEPTMQEQENYLERLLLQAAPRFPNLLHLDVNFVFDSASFKLVADRIKKDKTCRLSKSLKSLVLGSSEGREDGVDPNKYCEAVQFFLEESCTIEAFDCNQDFYDATLLPRGYQSALIKNTAIKSLFRDGRGSGLPSSIWPIIMKRVQRICNDRYRFHRDNPMCPSAGATGIYYLLREGPALIGRNDLNAASTNAAQVQLAKKRLKVGQAVCRIKPLQEEPAESA